MSDAFPVSTCSECGEVLGNDPNVKPCSCPGEVISLAGMALADMKALFAAGDSPFALGPHLVEGAADAR